MGALRTQPVAFIAVLLACVPVATMQAPETLYGGDTPPAGKPADVPARPALIRAVAISADGGPAAPGIPSKARSEGEIIRLVRQLGGPEDVRKAAAEELKEIGPPALPHIDQRHFGRGPEAMRAALQLIADIQAAHGIQPVVIHGMEFKVVTDSVWRIPPAGKTQAVKLGVRLTNRTGGKVFLDRFNAFQIAFIGPDGVPLKGYWDRDHVFAKDYRSPPMAEGERYTVSDFAVKLCRSADGKTLWLQGEDGCGGTFRYAVPSPGRIFFTIRCRDEGWPETRISKDGSTRWRGEGNLLPLTVEIK